MKKTVLFSIFALICLAAFGKPQISNISSPTQVGLYCLYEVSFNMSPSYSNPYDPAIIDAYALFQGPDGQQFKVNAFYFEDYSFSNNTGYEVATPTGISGWMIRFTPNLVGTWTFTIRAKDYQSNVIVVTSQRQFTCNNTNNSTGFISKANNRYLKQTKVVNGQNKDALYFPVGPNISWYTCRDYGHYHEPYGIYEYFDYIDDLEGNGNYFRLFINRYPFMSLYGKEYTTNVTYFDNTINQKDSKELDLIIEYAKARGISVMPCIFSHNDFVSLEFYNDAPDNWPINPFHTEISTIDKPCDFFSDPNAIRITKNLIRYIVSRWGYATNIMSWELWNEVNQMENDTAYFGDGNKCDTASFREAVIAWHDTMSQYIKSIDPFNHLVTTSTTTHAGINEWNPEQNASFFRDINTLEMIDIAQDHSYKNANNLSDNFQNHHFTIMCSTHDLINKPSFIGEFGYEQFGKEQELIDITLPNGSTVKRKYGGWQNDPKGIELHNSLWSGSFSGAMGAPSIWWWSYVFNKSDTQQKQQLFNYLKPVHRFFNNIPIPSNTFYPYSNKEKVNGTWTYPNGIETYYLMNENCDTIYGWAHDTNFRYQKIKLEAIENYPYGYIVPESNTYLNSYLRTLNSDRRPTPSSNSNGITIKVKNQPIGAQYIIKWYDSRTGNIIQTDLAYVSGSGSNKILSFEFPSSIRDLHNNKIHNNFGDVVFAIFLDCNKMVWKHGKLITNDLNNVGDEIVCNKNESQVFYKTSANKINSIWWNNNANCWQQANLNNSATNVKKCLAISDDGARIFYINTNDNINSIYYDYASSQWVYDNMNNASQGNVEGPIAVNSNNQVFYRNKNGALNALWFDSQANKWEWSSLNNSASSGVGDAIAVSPSQSQVFYKTTGNGLKAIKYDYSTSKWVAMSINNCANSGVKGPITITPNNQVFFRTTSNTINNIYYNGSIWQRSQLNNSATNVWSSTSTAGRILQADVTGKVFYINSSKQVDCIYWTPGVEWRRFSLPETENNVLALATNYDGNVYYLTNKSMTGLNKNQVYRFLYKSQCFAESSSPNVRIDRDIIDDDELFEETMDDMLFAVDENTSFDQPTVNIYPNPCSGNITVTSDNEIDKVYVFDHKGALVASYENNNHINTIIVDLSSYRNGLYIIKTQNHNGYSTVNKINKID